jgi:hypothetical protein
MKRIVIILGLLLISQAVVSAEEAAPSATTQAAATAGQVNYERPYYNQPNLVQPRRVNYAPKKSEVYKPASGNEYILKYVIDDLESAPWLNGGKRKI